MTSWRRCADSVSVAVESAQVSLVVDCAGLRTFDEHGVAMLVGLADYSARQQVRVVLANPPACLRQHLELAGLAWFFEWQPLFDDRPPVQTLPARGDSMTPKARPRVTDSEGPVSEDIMVPAQPDDNAIRVDPEAVDGQHHRVRVDRHADRSQHCEREQTHALIAIAASQDRSGRVPSDPNHRGLCRWFTSMLGCRVRPVGCSPVWLGCGSRDSRADRRDGGGRVRSANSVRTTRTTDGFRRGNRPGAAGATRIVGSDDPRPRLRLDRAE